MRGFKLKTFSALALAVLGFSSQLSAATVFINNTGIGYGADANYGIVSVGANSSLKINSGPIIGNVLVGGEGAVSAVDTSGGNNGGISGTINYSSPFTTATVQTAFGGLDNPPTAGQFQAVTTAFTTQAFNDAATLSGIASGLTADQTLATINSSPTIFDATVAGATGADGVFVVDVGQIQNADIILKGTSSSVFVFNVSGNYNTNKSLTLEGGVLATNVLFNFTATTGNVFQTSGGDSSVGVYLATNGGDFQFSNLALMPGNLINTGGHIEFVSGSDLTGTTGTPPPPPAPLPSTAMAGFALLLTFGVVKKAQSARGSLA